MKQILNNFLSDKPNVDLRVSIESQPLKRGNTIVLEAIIVSNLTRFDVDWAKDGQNIQKKEKFIGDHSDKLNPTLTICKATLDDKGTFSVRVTNAKGSEQKDIRIEIEGTVIYFLLSPS